MLTVKEKSPSGAAHHRPSHRPRRRQRGCGRSYTSVAGMYEDLANAYSRGRIGAVKRVQLCEMRPGDRVLYAGVGAGEEAVEAARLGARLTCIDLSSAMLSRLQTRLDRAACSAEIICGNAFDHHRPGHYDVVCANFLLNCFTEDAMRDLLAHLAGMVGQGGKLLIADLALPQGPSFTRCLQRAYARMANAAFWALGLAPLHPIYDYRRHLGDLGFTSLTTRSFPISRVLNVGYESITAIRGGEA